MPNRIKDFSTATTTIAGDDYFVLDGVTNGTRKLLGSNFRSALGLGTADTPTFAALALNGTLTFGAGASAAGTASTDANYGLVLRGKTAAVADVTLTRDDGTIVLRNDVGTNNLVAMGAISASGRLVSTGATSGIGYATGAGGTVTQATSKSTGVTLNKATGQITMNAAALAASTTVTFVLTNSAIAAGDLLVVNHISGGTAGSYTFNARSAAGSASIDVRNVSLGSLSEAIVISFAVYKGVTA